ncbi:uncharacterized protein LOC129911370 [Episyrphus balteatus]|uniref:uncharacterized protein LOC129911370 n=1 Tax=Episyrphus balteatus TaxID=286459 RepID=UPI002486872A|nr:uncharacterized protein LOC129911370 [Episyrphus balteatus]
MFKLVVLSVVLACVAAKPTAIAYGSAPLVYSASALIHEPAHLITHERSLEKVGDVVESVPTAVSHQSSTIVHDRANVVTPLVAPAIKTSITPAIRSYAAPVIAHQPLLQYALPYSYDYVKSPLYKSYVPSVPLVY